MSEPTHGPTQHHQPDKAGNPDTKGFFKGNTKWYLIGALAVIAVFTFIFVRKSNANSSTTSGSTGTGTLDPTTNALLQSALSTISAGGYGNAGSPGSGSPGTTQPSGVTSTGGSASSSPITISIPNAGGQSWESVVFPNQSALDSWTAWNQSFVNNNNAQATRSQWNQELSSLGVTGVGGMALTPPNSSSPNPYDRS